ncbi:MAG TPA: DMT family transporter, partial [Planctomycetota bacterium]|nr:DMT family transporter [Planctomycetota bacterium]
MIADVRRGAWAATAVALIWGVNVPVMKAAIATLHPFTFNALRLSCSVVVLGLCEVLARRRERVPTPWGTVVFLALLTSVVYQALFIGGIARTSAGHTGFIVASGPLWTALAGRAMGVERVGARAWVGLGLAFVGTALVVATAGGSEATTSGNLLVLAAMLAWAVGTVHSRGVLETFPAGRLAFLTSLVALPGHWLIALPHLDQLEAATLDGPLWAAILYSGALSTGLAYVFWNASVRSVGPSRTSAYTNLVPLVALAVAWAWLGERPTFDQLAGGALILVGIASWRV